MPATPSIQLLAKDKDGVVQTIGTLPVRSDGTVDIGLPSGAATSAKQDALAVLFGEVQASPTANTVLDRLKAIATLLSTQSGYLDGIEGNQTTGNSSLAAIATLLTTQNGYLDGIEGKQDAGNTSLANIVSALGGTLKTKVVDSSGVDVTYDDAPIGPTNETAPASDTATSGLNGRMQRVAQRVTSLIGLFPTSLGQKAAANSLSVVLAADGTSPSFNTRPHTGTVADPTGTTLTVKFAKIAATASGDNVQVAAVTGKKIRVLSYMLKGAGAVNAIWKSGTGGTTTDLTGTIPIGSAGDGAAVVSPGLGLFETASGSALNLYTSAAVVIGGHLAYIEV